MEDQKKITAKGGTMRLGAYGCDLNPGSLAYRIYGYTPISERHRHRWEFNNKYLSQFEKPVWLPAAGTRQPASEIVELPTHPFFIGFNTILN